ncbi:MAG: hypothetical protein HN914_07910 [Candidatus Marinimicrobia bacterium]|nr:hypothetical protein [Candidatus Neomarinimicrobiota bacterium]
MSWVKSNTQSSQQKKKESNMFKIPKIPTSVIKVAVEVIKKVITGGK